MKNIKFLWLIVLLGAFSFSAFSQKIKPCFQDAEAKLKLIKEAEQKQFNVKYVEISGNTYTRDRKFRNYAALNEGDIFTKRNLLLTIQGFNKVVTIFPIKLENVEVRLDREKEQVNLTFCVIQRKRT